MARLTEHLTWKEAVPRIAADLLLVYASMTGALALSVSYQTMRGNYAGALQCVNYLMSSSSALVWLLGPIFITVFLLMGIYSGVRRKSGSEKRRILLRGVGVSLAVVLAAHYVVLAGDPIGRSLFIPFALFSSLCLTLARILKARLQQQMAAAGGPAPPDRLLVIGGAGYIGSTLVRQLLDRGEKVRVLDSLLYGSEPLAEVLAHPNLDLMVGDTRHIQDVIAAMKGVKAVVHLAAIVGDPACEVDRQTTLEINYAATRMLIEIAKGHGVRRFVFASSCSVYGMSDEEMDETSSVNPISLYAQTKVDSENALLSARTDSFHPAILRFATIFGLGYRPRFDLVVNLLSAKAWQEGVITVFNGEQWRPFLHVRDVAEAIVAVLDAPLAQVGGQVFNVGDSHLNHTLADVADKILAALPGTRVERVENSDKRNYRVNFAKIRALGFRAKYRLEDGIAEMLEALRNGAIADYKSIRYHNQRFIAAVGTQANKSELDTRVMAAFAGKLRPMVVAPGLDRLAAAVESARPVRVSAAVRVH